MQEFPSWPTRTPDDNFRCVILFRLNKFLQQRRQNVRGLQIEVVSGAVQVRRHEADSVKALLLPVRLAHLNAGDFGDGIPFVG